MQQEEQEITEKPILDEQFADNGAHSHWHLINPKTGEVLWSDFPEETIAKGQKIPSMELYTTQELSKVLMEAGKELPDGEAIQDAFISPQHYFVHGKEKSLGKCEGAEWMRDKASLVIAELKDDVMGFVEWKESEGFTKICHLDNDDNGSWYDEFTEGINRHYFTTEQLYSKYKDSKKQ